MQEQFILSNQLSIPSIGFGTWQTPNGDVAISSVKYAIESGYTHIDTAAIYGNEKSIGQAIKESGVSREKLFITSKVWNSDRGYESTKKAFPKP
jgi:diketogulonate reductase-like aldo/keto reductase